MLKEHTNIFRQLIIVGDLLIVAGCFFWGYMIRIPVESLRPIEHYFLFLPLMLVAWVGTLHYTGMYRSIRTHEPVEIFYNIFKSAVIAFAIFSSTVYVVRSEGISRSLITVIFLLTTIGITSARLGLLYIFRYVRYRGFNYRNILLVGTGQRAQRFLRVIEQHNEWGLRVIGLIDEEQKHIGEQIQNYKVLGTLKNMGDVLDEMVVDEVVFVVPGEWLDKIQEAIFICEGRGVKVFVAVDFFETKLFRNKVTTMGEFPLLTLENTPDQLWHLLIKRIFDIIFSSLALIILSPVFMIIALLIKWTSPGPVFFQQVRCGLNSRRFILYKFRTMVPDAHTRLKALMQDNEMSGPVFKITNDPRLTPIGKFLRKTSLDEIPQFWNVIKGDMSLIGPRPPIPEEVKQYDDWHRKRLRMRPGITCLWQVQGRNNISDFDEWAKLDVEYIENWSLFLDFKILLKTIPAVLSGVGAK